LAATISSAANETKFGKQIVLSNRLVIPMNMKNAERKADWIDIQEKNEQISKLRKLLRRISPTMLLRGI